MRILIIDSSYLAYRSFYSMDEDLSWREQQTGVLYGFLSQIFQIADSFETSQFVFAWDSRKRYRKQIYPAYKEKTEELDEENKNKKRNFYRQVSILREEIIPGLGFKNSFIQTGLEADDVIAYLVRRNPGMVIVSADNDLWQLLDDADMYNPKTRLMRTKEEFIKRWGIKPSDWVMVKQIAGCRGDNVQGINDVGELTAANYILGIDINWRQKLMVTDKAKKLIKFNERLVKLPFEPNRMNFKIILPDRFKFDDWNRIFTKYGFKSFMEKKFFNNLKRRFKLK